MLILHFSEEFFILVALGEEASGVELGPILRELKLRNFTVILPLHFVNHILLHFVFEFDVEVLVDAIAR